MKKLLFVLFIVLLVGLGFSQETGKVGFLFKAGSSNNVGICFNLSDKVTLRPSFGFNTSKSNLDYTGSNIDIDRKLRQYSANLGLLYQILKKDHFSAYGGLELGYVFQKTSGNTCYSGACSSQWEKINGYTGGALLGLQYNLNKHLAVFGEVGFGFRHYKGTDNTPTIIDDTLITERIYKENSWDLSRSGFGIILYL